MNYKGALCDLLAAMNKVVKGAEADGYVFPNDFDEVLRWLADRILRVERKNERKGGVT